MMALPELLSPAGDESALRAAVDSGANAVYLGYKAYGARASALNFDEDALARGAAYAHLYHARVYVTVNTLVKQGELAGVGEALDAIRAAGADAVLTQDLGVARLVRDSFPELRLHASTQMGLSNAADALFAKRFGFSRVVLARECSLAEIARVAATGVEAEVFAHGALCAGVSGRCLMSSMAGGRSGNRGRCAQPCRMRFTLNGREAAWLSMRDLCTYRELPALCGAGVASLKLEGRLKSPEYVAVVTGVYRRALDAIAAGCFDPDDPKPMEALRQIFNRGGFTRGHGLGAEDGDLCVTDRVSHEGVPMGELTAVRGALAEISLNRDLHDGDSLQLRNGQTYDLRYSGRDALRGTTATLRLRPEIRVAPGCRVARLSDAKQLEAARAHAPKPIEITMSAVFEKDQPMRLSLSDGVSQTTVLGDAVQAANSRAATAADAARQLGRLGDSPFALAKPESLTVTMGEGLFLPVSALNALRRRGVEALTEARLQAYRLPPRSLESPQGAESPEMKASQPSAQADCQPAQRIDDPRTRPQDPPITVNTLAVAFREPELAQGLLNSGATLLIYDPASYRPAELDAALDRLPGGTWLKLPPQCSQLALESVIAAVQKHRAALGGLVLNSLGQIGLVKGLPAMLGDMLPITDQEAVEALGDAPLCAFTLWPEWTYAEQRAFVPAGLPALMKLYGRETLMLLNHCPYRVMKGLTAGRESCRLCQGADMACGQLNAELQDQRGYRFPLRRTAYAEGCLLSVLNALPTDLRACDEERRALNAGMLLSFTTETPAEQLSLAAAFASLLRGEKLPPPQNATAGHWRRGVE